MKPPRLLPPVLTAAIFLAAFGCTPAPPRAASSTLDDRARVVARVADAARDLLALLSAREQAQLVFAFDDHAQRQRWSNLPTGMFERRGLRLGDLTTAQRQAVDRLLAATLSPRGRQEVRDIMRSDDLLAGRTGPTPGRVYGSGEFYLAFLGKPAANRAWAWQLGGHHLALHATVNPKQITLTPCFTGGNPAHFHEPGHHAAHLGGDLRRAHTLLASLPPATLRRAVVGPQSVPLAHGPGRPHPHPHADDAPKHPVAGVPGSALNRAQRQHLMALIEDRVGLLHPAHARPLLQAVATTLDQTHFAWWGPWPPQTAANPGPAGAYRIHGPRVLIEFSPRSTTPDGHAGHTHAVYRNPALDRGAR